MNCQTQSQAPRRGPEELRAPDCAPVTSQHMAGAALSGRATLSSASTRQAQPPGSHSSNDTHSSSGNQPPASPEACGALGGAHSTSLLQRWTRDLALVKVGAAPVAAALRACDPESVGLNLQRTWAEIFSFPWCGRGERANSEL